MTMRALALAATLALSGPGMPTASAAERNLAMVRIDPIVCSVTVVAQGHKIVVEIRENGDVYVNGVLVWKCPPYDGG